jgi:transcriptional regulator with XRE-family HTH domain
MSTFGHTLKTFRQRLGREWTQERLGYEVGVSRNTVSNWESGKYLPSRDMVLHLAEKLLLSPQETDRLLFDAQYPLEYQRRDPEQAALTQIAEARVGHMVVDHLEVKYDATQFHLPSRHDFYAHIPMPPNYIERTEVLAAVHGTLLSDMTAVALTSQVKSRPNALYGMGGIGKTIIARALCEDSKIQAAFPEGILWVTLGQTPELVPKMREWIYVLGGTISEKVPTVDSLKVTLAQLLKDRACLLILDDVWRSNDAEAFLVGGSRCRVLLTTRKVEIANKLGARMQPIPIMAPFEAIKLLEQWANGCIAKTNSELKGQIVKRLGYLPLALKLAGVQLQRKAPDEWLHNFNIRKLKYQEVEDRQDSLELTIRLSLDDLDEEVRHLYVALAIFKEDEATPQVGIERLWQGMSGLNAEETTDLLYDLAARALIDFTSHQFVRVVRMHDLLHDLASAELGNRSVATHQVLLNIYRTTCRGKGWHTANDDHYLYNHLAYHLRAAELFDELKGLFADQEWMLVRVPQSDYTYDGYLQDLFLAWEYASTEAKQEIEANNEPSALAEGIRYALILTSINSIAENFIPQMVRLAVEADLWTPNRAISVAARIPDEKRRAKMCVELLRTERLSKEQEEQVLQIAIQAAAELNYDPIDGKRTEILADLIPFLPQGEAAHLLEQELENVLAMPYEWGPDEEVAMFYQTREAALSNLLPLLSQEQRVRVLERELEISIALPDDKIRGKALFVIAPYLIDSLLERGFEAALSLKDTQWRSQLLAALVPRLKSKQLVRSMEVTLTLSDESASVHLLLALIPYLEAEQLLEVGEVALALKDEWHQSQILAALVPRLTSEQRTWVEQIASTLSNQVARVKLLAALVPYLREEQSNRILEDELEKALALTDEWKRFMVLATLIPRMTSEQLTRVLEVALSRASEIELGNLLAALAPKLIAEQHTYLLERLITAILTLPYEWGHQEHIPFIPQTRSKVLAELLPRLSVEQRIKVLDHELKAALSLTDDWVRARVLANLMPHLTSEQHDQLVRRELEAFLELPNEWRRAESLKAFIPLLNTEQRNQVLEVTLALTNENYDAQVLASLASYLPAKQCSYALEIAQTITNEESRALAIAALTRQLGPQQHNQELKRVLKVAVTMVDRSSSTEILELLVPQLDQALLDLGLQDASTIVDDWKRALALTILAPGFNSEQQTYMLEREIENALTLTSEWKRTNVLSMLAPQLRNGLLERVIEVSHTLSDEGNRNRILAKLAPTIIVEKHPMWMEAALALINEWDGILIEEMPHFTIEQCSQVLENALALSDELKRKEVLIALVPQLTPKQRAQVLAATQALSDERNRAEGLAALLPYLADQLSLLRAIRLAIVKFLAAIQHQPWSREDMLQRFFIKEIFMPPIFSDKTLGIIASHIIEICEKWFWL